MGFVKAAGVRFTLAGLLFVGGGVLLEPAPAQAASPQAQESAARPIPRDDLQRSMRIYTYTMTAESGPQRGEVLYFYKCWMCHNKYTKSAPYLSDLFQRPRLATGEPVSQNTVAEKIRNGSQRMPGFRHSLSDADMADLMAYLRSGKCCYEEDEPPLNPWYHKP
ncbi:MAG: c-type cytochrome [Terriglobia bacterium]